MHLTPEPPQICTVLWWGPHALNTLYNINKTSNKPLLDLKFHFPPIHPALDGANLYPEPAVTPIWPSRWRPLIRTHLWPLTITLSPCSALHAARRWGARGLYNWFLEHSSCFMCPHTSPQRSRGVLPHPPSSISPSAHVGWKTTAK